MIEAGAERPEVEPLRSRRDFLLRSITDLEAEHANGDLPLERYRQLHDDYTVQAANVLRALAVLERRSQDDDSPPPLDQVRKRRLSPIVTFAVLGIVVLGGVFLTKAIGDRAPGQTITGNAQSKETDIVAMADAARAQPDDPSAQFSYGEALLRSGQSADALKAFDEAARLDPTDPAAKAYGGMVVYLAGLVDEAIRRLDSAVAADPSYPDARFFRGLVHLRGRNDPAMALTDLRAFLRLVPPGPERDQVQALVSEIEGANVRGAEPGSAPTSSPQQP